MSPYASQQWTRRIRYGDQHIRISDAERNAVAERLAAHYADGRLDQAELDNRVSQTMAAKTRGDLAGLFDDLPDVSPAGAAGTASPGDQGYSQIRHRRGRRRGGFIRPILLLALIMIGTSVAWHAFTSLFFVTPLVWMLLIGCLIVLLSGFARHRRLDLLVR